MNPIAAILIIRINRTYIIVHQLLVATMNAFVELHVFKEIHAQLLQILAHELLHRITEPVINTGELKNRYQLYSLNYGRKGHNYHRSEAID